jgi:hypothetical protein
MPIEIRKTYFPHIIPNDIFIMPDEADASWKVIDGKWVAPTLEVTE